MTEKLLRMPLATTNAQFDTDSPSYRGGNPATYMVSAFCYDSLAAPAITTDNGVMVPDYSRMRWRLGTARPGQDFRTWRIDVRAGALSNAGKVLSAEDVKWSLSRAFGLDAMGAWRWRDVAGVESCDDIEILDSSSVLLRLRSPNPHLDSYLFSAAPSLFDSVTASSHATTADPWALRWLASGAEAGFAGYEISEHSDVRLRFDIRDADSEDADIGSAVAVEPVATRAEGMSYLEARTPAYVVGLRCDEAVAWRRHADVRLHMSRAGHTSVELNYHRPPFDDRRVRQALSLATPYEEVIRSGFLGLAGTWQGPLPTYDRWRADGNWPYLTNEQAARELLHKAGYSQGFQAPLYLPDRPDAVRIGEILQAAYSPLGIEVTLRDMRELPDGWQPPMYLRLECGHNFNEPMYDLAHDYVPLNRLATGSPVKEGIGTWFPRYPGSRELEARYLKAIHARTAAERQRYCIALQRSIIRLAPSIFLAENLQINASTAPASAWAADHNRRAIQALQLQNCNTAYLPQN